MPNPGKAPKPAPTTPPAEPAASPPPPYRLQEDGTLAVDPASSPAVEPTTVLNDPKRGLWLYRANCLEFLDALAAKHGPGGAVDLIFADPPYFLSNGGITCHAGRMVKVDKGSWDKSQGPELNHQFNLEWLRRCRNVLKPNGSIWITGTQHVIFSVGYALQQLGFKILNHITWEKPNPPPNLSCRYFTHSTESLIWAARSEKSRHVFDYPRMRQENGGRQMKAVWRLAAPSVREKSFGKHPTQKPVALVRRCLAAASREGDLVLDPFVGSGTTVVAAALSGRRAIGIDTDRYWLEIAVNRLAATGELQPALPGLPT